MDVPTVADAKFAPTLLPNDWFSIVLGIFGFVGVPSISAIAAVLWRSRKAERLLNEGLVKAIDASQAQIEELKQRLAQEKTRADAYDPYVWLETARNEQEANNEVKAIDALRTGVSRTTESLQEVYFQLARHHFALYPDNDASLQLQEAGRLARVASLLKPKDRRAEMLVQQIGDVSRIEDIRLGRLALSENDPWSLDPSRYGGGMGSDAASTIEQLSAVGRKLAAKGLYLGVEVIAHRVRSIALCELGDFSEITCTARFFWAGALLQNGYYQKALQEIEQVLPIRDAISGSEHPEALDLRQMHARLLDHLGRYEEALAEINTLLPIEERVRGIEDPSVLTTRRHRASALDHLGRPTEALAEIIQILPILEHVRGNEDLSTRATRRLHCRLLIEFCRYEEALAEIDALLAIDTQVGGNEHPQTLATYQLHATVLNEMGRAEEALTEIETLLPIEEKISGSEHPATLTARQLRADALGNLGRYEEALGEIDTLLRLRARVTGSEHPDFLLLRHVRAGVLTNLARYDEALAEISVLLPIEERVRCPDNAYTLRTRSLRASVLNELGRSEDALAEFSAVLPIQQRVCGSEHPTRSSRASGMPKYSVRSAAPRKRLQRSARYCQLRNACAVAGMFPPS